MSVIPPRLLAGATLLYWGYITGHLAAAVPAAILLESRSILNLRWDFKGDGYIRAWHFCILCGVLVAGIAWLNGMKIGRIHLLFTWAPFILLPLELAQRFGNADKIPLNTFSFFASRKMQQDLREGRDISPRMINTGYLYIAITLLAATKASHNGLHHFIGLCLIVGACFYAYTKKNGYRPWAWTSAFVLVILFTQIGQMSMFKLRRYYRGDHTISDQQNISTNENITRIGKLKKIKPSPRIFWRMQATEGSTPKLLGYASYNQYDRGKWSYEFNEFDESAYDEFGYRPNLSSAATTAEDRDIRWFSDQAPQLTKKAPITIIGEVEARVKEHPLPLPHDFLAIGDLDKEAYTECNRLGTVRMANPNYNVVEYAIWPGIFSTTEEPPDQNTIGQRGLDLSLPTRERDALQRVCEQLDLFNPSLTTEDKVDKIRWFFLEHFKYSTHNTTPNFDRGRRDRSMSIFLEESRMGHCEYFATATTLLLRKAGIPARYCIGFAVQERDRKRDEWVMRGHHAHAWCRAWIEKKNSRGEVSGHWENVDLTPPSWQSVDLAATNGWRQQFADWWQRTSEDFLIWRTRETNKNKVYTVVGVILALLALWILWRLWSTRQRNAKSTINVYQRPEGTPLTALNKLEGLAAKKIGPRPVGAPLCIWLRGILDCDHSSRQTLEQLLTPAILLHSAIRFDPAGATSGQNQKLTELCAPLKKAIKEIPS